MKMKQLINWCYYSNLVSLVNFKNNIKNKIWKQKVKMHIQVLTLFMPNICYMSKNPLASNLLIQCSYHQN